MLILQIAAGIVLGSLVVAFLKTTSGRYTLLGAVAGLISGGIWGSIVLTELDGISRIEGWQKTLWLLSIPAIALIGGWWLPRTVFVYRRSIAESQGKDAGHWLKRAADQAFTEAIWAPVVAAYFLALILGPFAWGFGDSTLRSWGRGGTLVAWGFVLLAVAFEIHAKRRGRQIDAMLAAEKAAKIRDAELHALDDA